MIIANGSLNQGDKSLDDAHAQKMDNSVYWISGEMEDDPYCKAPCPCCGSPEEGIRCHVYFEEEPDND